MFDNFPSILFFELITIMDIYILGLKVAISLILPNRSRAVDRFDFLKMKAVYDMKANIALSFSSKY